MNLGDLFTFEETPWEQARRDLQTGDTMDAAAFLTLMEGEDEDTLEEAFQTLEDLSVSLDLGGLPKAPGTGAAAERLRLEERLAAQPDMAAGLDPEDPLGLYLREVAALPSCGDLASLTAELAKVNGAEVDDAPVRGAVADLCLGRVVELAREYVGRGVLLLDLIQEGSMGLWQGILAWPGAWEFEVHRDWWIRQYMARAVVTQARQNGVGQRMRQAMEDYRSVDERLLGELGRNPTPEEIAEQLHMTPEEGEAVRKMLENARSLGRIQAAREPAEPQPEEEQAVEDTAYFQTRQRIEALLSGLEELDAKILTLRFGLEGGLPLTPEQTGARLGLTGSQVTARETAALGRLRGEGS